MARSPQLAELFRNPALVAHRNYEICKAYYSDDVPAVELARRYSLHPDTVRAIVRDFASNPDLAPFFLASRPGPCSAPKRDLLAEEVARLRSQDLSLGEIQEQLHGQGHSLSESYLFRILQRQGVAGPRRRQQPGQLTHDGSVIPPVADASSCSLQPGRRFATKVAGLFLFLPQLLELDLPAAVEQAGWPGSEAIPPVNAILALLAPKLLGQRRISHISDLCNDEGAGLFAGLNVLPKVTYATDYSYRTERAMSDRFVACLLARTSLGELPFTFNLDFHTIPFRGRDADLEEHWLAGRNRAGTAVMAFVAQQRQRRVICYATADVLRAEAELMAVRFADHWKTQTGYYPGLVLFDSRVTTYAGLAGLEERQVGFITIRRRGCAMLRRVENLPEQAWQRGSVTQAKGQKRTIQYVDEEVQLEDYPGRIRQIVVRGLGREEPTFLLTNNRPQRQTAREVVQTYARRNLVENSLGEQITFFHLDCLSSDVRLNVDFDLTLTVFADLLYRRLGQRLKGFERASPQKLFRKFVDTMGSVEIEEEQIRLRLTRRAHNPILKAAGLTALTAPVPWLGGRPVLFDLP
jgi:hypothetical protein